MLAAKQGKFASSDTAPLNFAYHFDAVAYGRFLKQLAIDAGVTHIEGDINRVQQCPTSGNITSLNLADNSEIKGDFFIDCTGFKGLGMAMKAAGIGLVIEAMNILKELFILRHILN